MKNILFWIKSKKNAFIYTTFLFCIFELLIGLYKEFAPAELERFYVSAILFGVILFATLLYGLLYIRKRYTSFEVSQVVWPLVRIHMLHQIILPILLYIGMVGFIFFYPRDIITQVMVVVVSAVYWLLFINIQAVYDRNFELQSFTHGIYNLVKIFTFFLVMTSSLELFHYLDASPLFTGLATFLISFVLLVLALVRYMQTSTISVIIAIIFSFVIGVFGMVLGSLMFSSYFSLGLYVTILYYLLSSLMNHKAEGTLNFSVIVEYLSVAVIAMMMLSTKF